MMKRNYYKKVDTLRKRLAKLQEENASLKIINNSLEQDLRQANKEKYLLERYIDNRDLEMDKALTEVKEIREKYLTALKMLKAEKQLYKLRFQELKKDMKKNK